MCTIILFIFRLLLQRILQKKMLFTLKVMSGMTFFFSFWSLLTWLLSGFGQVVAAAQQLCLCVHVANEHIITIGLSVAPLVH